MARSISFKACVLLVQYISGNRHVSFRSYSFSIIAVELGICKMVDFQYAMHCAITVAMQADPEQCKSRFIKHQLRLLSADQ